MFKKLNYQRGVLLTVCFRLQTPKCLVCRGLGQSRTSLQLLCSCFKVGSGMEEGELTRLGELLMCPVCQEIFKDPRQLPCGHSLCIGCLENLMDHSLDSSHRCPDCRANFGEIDGLHRSYALANIAEDFRLNKRRREKKAESVYCDCCVESRVLAVKTCLKCEVSMCKEHVKGHVELPAFTGHPLVEPLSDLLERKCPQHQDEVLRFYCNSSRRYICNICALQSKQHGSMATEISAVLRRQMTESMDQHFKTLTEQVLASADAVNKLQEGIQHDRLRMKPVDTRLNGVTIVLLFLWFIVLYYAYSYSVENQSLTLSLHTEQSRVHQIYSTITELLIDHPFKNQKPPEAEHKEGCNVDLNEKLKAPCTATA
ncbi:E3 ubiquitin/ISG15 ligase TRIM25-like [Cololabis saira]|uniref:E3 ubiquitin/ISG15 ligase TRIM25-like n=1 Tax=Cololabis saira TaxID=129043 RepID=UPI002AD309D2|nr:E3 ubiquitin/ISG15 ligase TRIM25-like [Cololabis saira]XP_061587227.1 E3 ubiquitin/ISG15 ligase TRIM25-like [Cololabis saira]